MKSRLRQMWKGFVDAYWAGARARFEKETLPYMYPPIKTLSPADMSPGLTVPSRLRERTPAGVYSSRKMEGAKVMYRASIENRGDSKHYVTTRHATFVMDTEGQGSNPIDTLLASLCGCIGHRARDYMREQGIASLGFTVTAEADLAKDKTRLGDISLLMDMKGTQLNQQQRSELLKYVERCKIHNSLKSNSSINLFLNGE
jgi:uncharacterized OsmC-like protein